MAGEAHHVMYCLLTFAPLVVSIAAFFFYWMEFFFYLLEEDLSRQSFDFIIVGGGAAGSVLAARLSEVKGWRVLLIEAGGVPSPLSSIPMITPLLQLSSYDWQVETVTQSRSCKAMVGGRCRWPSGKMLGGSSGLNYMLAVRGEGADYDSWAEATGDPSWNYSSLLPYFNEMEETLGLAKPHTSDIAQDYLSMAQSMGLYNKEEEGEELIARRKHEGRQAPFGVPLVHQNQGSRADTYRRYLREAMQSRSNLVVVTQARATNIILRENKAVGVAFSRYGKEVEVFSKKEVLVSCGTVASAKLLLLSGVGPAPHLNQLGIPVSADLPVGENLQDHLTTTLGPFMLDTPVGFNPLSLLSPYTHLQYLARGLGPLSTVGVDAMAFLHTRSHERSKSKQSDIDLEEKEDERPSVDDRPDYQLLFMSSWLLGDYWTFVWKTFGLDGPKAWEGYYRHLYSPASLHAVSILPILLRPRSRGTVRLSSKSPWDPPLVDPCYLCDQSDSELLVKAIQQTVDMVNGSSELKRHGFELPDLHWPGCEEHLIFSAEYWACYLSHVSLTMYHPVGTCQMGKTTNPKAVVDSQLRVLGTKGLRVVDASVMPTIVSGNTQAATLVIAEKGAAMIRQHWTSEDAETLGQPLSEHENSDGSNIKKEKKEREDEMAIGKKYEKEL